jgi:AhpC/TSA family
MRYCLLLILSFFHLGAMAADTALETLAPGAPLPEFALPGVDGRNWSQKDFQAAKALVVVFTCNHCPTAQAYEERLKKLATDYKQRGVEVVAISPNDPKSVRLDAPRITPLTFLTFTPGWTNGWLTRLAPR